MIQIYAVDTEQGENVMLPVFVMTDGKIYRTVNHPQGWAAHPDYEMKTDGCLYRTNYHPQGAGQQPDFKFGPDQLIYRTRHHPDGRHGEPVFAVYEGY